jgi:arylsulfatase A-like enzyme
MYSNLVIITVDALRADRVKPYGGKGITPVIDSLSDGATVFLNAVTPGNCTLPGHGAIFTGKYPKNNGMQLNGWRFNKRIRGIAKTFQENGFETCGNSSIEYMSSYLGFNRGYNTFFNNDPSVKYYALFSRFRLKVGRYTFRLINFLKKKGLFSIKPYKDPKKVTSEILPWLEKNKNKKFFLWTYFHGGHVDDKKEQEEINRNADTEIGKIIAKIKSLGLMDKTLFVIAADHGEGLNEHGKTGHGWSLYDEELKVPLLFIGKGIPKKQIKKQVSLVNIFPTVLDYFGIKVKEDFDGKSLKKLIDGKDPLFKEDVFCENYPDHHKSFCLRTAYGYKLILNENGTKEMYNLNADPKEKKDLIKVEKDTAKKLLIQLNAWIKTGTRFEASQKRDADIKESLKNLGYI